MSSGKCRSDVSGVARRATRWQESHPDMGQFPTVMRRVLVHGAARPSSRQGTHARCKHDRVSVATKQTILHAELTAKRCIYSCSSSCRPDLRPTLRNHFNLNRLVIRRPSPMLTTAPSFVRGAPRTVVPGNCHQTPSPYAQNAIDTGYVLLASLVSNRDSRSFALPHRGIASTRPEARHPSITLATCLDQGHLLT